MFQRYNLQTSGASDYPAKEPGAMPNEAHEAIVLTDWQLGFLMRFAMERGLVRKEGPVTTLDVAKALQVLMEEAYTVETSRTGDDSCSDS